MFIHIIRWEGIDVDLEKWTFWDVLIYGASTGIVLYMFIWLCELGHAWIWNY